MYRATLVKGKTFSFGKFNFNIRDNKSQIIPDEFVKFLEDSGKFRLEKIEDKSVSKLETKKVDIEKSITVRRTNIEKSKVVFIIGHISKVDGYGCLGNRILQKYPAVVQTARDNLNYEKSKQKDLSDIPRDNIIIQLTSPNRFRKINGFKKVIGFTMFEATEIPKEWPKLIKNTCDELIVPAKEVKKVFKNCGVDIPIHVLPLWADDRYKYFKRPARDTFTFLFIGTVTTANRKGLLESIEAFKKEFKNNKNVRFIIKASNLSLSDEMISSIKKDSRIKIIRDKLNYDDMNKLYKKADCFVFATHGEGFGLPPLEAMATGLPTIVTDWMGCKEFVDSRYCYPIKVNKLEEAIYAEDYGYVGDWAVVKVRDIRKQMRYIYDNQKKAKKKGKLAAKYVDKYFRFKNFDTRLNKVLFNKEIETKEYDNKVSIILAIKDNLKYLKQCIKSIYKYTKEEFELILIDNDSNADVKKFLKKLKKKVKNIRIITNIRNMGYAYACNQGIKLAKYDYLCMLDIDTIVTPNWLTKMLDCMKQNKDCGICTPSQSALTKNVACVPFTRDKNKNIVDDVVDFSKTLKDGFEERQIFAVYGFCHLVKRNVYEDIGVYDWKRYYKLASNETDLYWRAGLVGYKIYWVKGAYVYHYHSKVKTSLGLNGARMAEKGHAVFRERQKEPENYYVENDVILEKPKNKVGIIFVTHDNAEGLTRTIKSVLTQSYYNWELYIIDNNSKDNTEKFVESFNDDRIKYFYLDKFSNNARKIGVKKCKTKYVAFIEDNTCFKSKHLEKMLEAIKANGTKGIQCFNSRNYYKNMILEKDNITVSNLLLTKKDLKKDNIETTIIPAVLTEIYDNKEIEKLERYFNV